MASNPSTVAKLFATIIALGLTAVAIQSWVDAREKRYEEQEATRHAQVVASKLAAEKAAFAALSPAQHLAEADKAISMRQLDAANRHLAEVPKKDPRRVNLEASEVKMKIQMEAEGKAAKAKAEKEKLADMKAKMEGTGEKPDMIVLEIALKRSIKESAHDPDSVTSPDLSGPFPDFVKIGGMRVGCWRVPFRFRAKNMFGGLVLQPESPTSPHRPTRWGRGPRARTFAFGSRPASLLFKGDAHATHPPVAVGVVAGLPPAATRPLARANGVIGE